jgi:formylglycine-generating enzyme required for sulfatase activity
LIRPGQFTMGSPPREPGRDQDEGPRRTVTISRPFYIGVTELTQAQYAALTGSNPSRFRSATAPVHNVDWQQAMAFCRRASEHTGRTVTLPTEAQWEYACRARSQGRFCYGDDTARLALYATYRREAGSATPSRSDPGAPPGRPTHAASRRPNAWGLYDMHGNVFEWCRDWYADRYDPSDAADPAGPPQGPYHVLRGGSYASPPWLCRSAYRHRYTADGRYDHLIGFRVVVLPDATSSAR